MTRGLKLALAALLGLASAAFADDGRAEFEQANRFFEAGEYAAALPLFQKAYTDSGKRPSTIRALAQCERALELYDEALLHFREYVATKPKEEAQILETIAIIEELKAHKSRSAQAPPPPASPAPVVVAPPITEAAPPLTDVAPPPADEPGLDPILWVAIGVAVGVGTGVVLGVALSGEGDPSGGTTGVVIR